MPDQGTVKWFIEANGFGFITQDDGNDIFVRGSDIRASGPRSLRRCQRVEFTVATGPRGAFATQVQLL
ncbi:cold shock domain-containing protein [Nocardia sp. NPDC050710]|uniref:cold-shock protein n=1 Tax=Nocardia sp. NPDC050710 TaxID=3157220 RepID=UPI0033C7B3AD